MEQEKHTNKKEKRRWELHNFNQVAYFRVHSFAVASNLVRSVL
jgi:hypothetical protein